MVAKIRFFNTFEPVTSFYRDLLPFLAENGLLIEVMVSASEYRSGRRRLHEKISHPNIKFKDIGSALFSMNTVWQKLVVMLSFMFGSVFSTIVTPFNGINFFLTQPPFFALWGYVLKVIRHQPYMCLVMDIYPDVAIKYGLLSENAQVTRSLRNLSRFVLRNADAVIVIGRCMRELLVKEGIPADRIILIENWANEKEVIPIHHNNNELRNELGLQGSFVVLYSGNMGRPHLFDDILEVARRLNNINDLRFVFIGDGARKKEIESAITNHGLTNILMLPFQPIERLPESLSLGDIHFISLRSGFEGLVVPSKAYGSLAVGRPIIYQGSSKGEIARMIDENQIGMVVLPKDVDGLERSILCYFRDRVLVEVQGKRALELSRGQYSRSRAIQKYLSLLESRFSNPPYTKTIYERK